MYEALMLLINDHQYFAVRFLNIKYHIYNLQAISNAYDQTAWICGLEASHHENMPI